MKMFNCDGTVAVHNGGDLRGHVAPGAMFILWATHWMLASFLQHVRNPRRYRAQPTYPLLHYDYVPVEQLFKFVLPLVGLTGEIWWANGYA